MPCIDLTAMQFVLEQTIPEIYYYLNKNVQYASIDIFQKDLKHLV